MAPRIIIEPPLLNSASPWATTLADLDTLYQCPHTGAVTTRTSLIAGFQDDPNQHQHCFFDAGAGVKEGMGANVKDVRASLRSGSGHEYRNSSLNTYGYSPVPLKTYLSYIEQLVQRVGNPMSTTKSDDTETITESSRIASPTRPTKLPAPASRLVSKPIIISVTGEPHEISEAYHMISELSRKNTDLALAMEINLSCPNIANKPPPAYSATELKDLLGVVAAVKSEVTATGQAKEEEEDDDDDEEKLKRTNTRGYVALGLKLPPYTYLDQFRTVVECLVSINGLDDKTSIIDFITCTNTLGSSLVFDENNAPALKSEAGTGMGGMAGAAIHSLSLGNVATFRRLLVESPETKEIMIIGVGGVSDRAGFDRMRAAGATAVGVATALGQKGVGIFEEIAGGDVAFA